MDKLLARFRRRLMIEAIGKATLMGLLIGASIELAFLIVMHLISRDPGLVWIGIVFGVPFCIAFALFFGVAYYPTQKRVTRRVDASGLQERAGTMLQFMGQESTILQMQRNDATQKIEMTATQKVRFFFNKKIILACTIVLALSVGCMFVPYTIMNIFAKDTVEEQPDDSQWIQDLLDELRDKVENADVSDEIKDKLEDVLDELEKDLSDAKTDLEKVGDINKAESKIEEILKEYLTKYSIGAALQQFDSTKELGKAIEDGNKDGVSTALDHMEDKLLALEGEEQSTLLDTIASDITQALEISGAPETDHLYLALDHFSKGLSSASDTVKSGKDATAEIQAAIKQAEKDILAALEEQEKIEELLKDMEGTLEGAKDEMLGTEGEPGEEGEEGQEGQEGEEGKIPGEGEEGELPGGTNGNQPGEGDPNGEQDTPTNMTEGIYDPSFGSVQYGEVFATYYAEYLASLKEGEVPEDMQTILERYFNSLNK